jgi:hypothetical protein
VEIFGVAKIEMIAHMTFLYVFLQGICKMRIKILLEDYLNSLISLV